MSVILRDITTVLLPGTGSDDDYVYRAFSTALHEVGAHLVTPPPQPGRLIAGYLDALDNAARSGPVAVGGVSIGAVVALRWALDHPRAATAVLAALPPWMGSPHDAPAALLARQSAHSLRRNGLGATVAEMRRNSPAWLADELARSWSGQWPALPETMDEAAAYPAPECAELERLTVPMGVAVATDDPVHPAEVGYAWVAAAPRAALRTVTLEQMGADTGSLGAACVAALGDV
ncbi:alpha/beta fold hydrolase [Mycolicibacterium goodii]|uniref:Alpha/beta hydrolase n=1 Tax=Mycolicibacterium goodii TaxID=134601 RepID=A0ABS6HXX2_MYCGD|nr:alpha/beta hydrolase [Mycolicibacterium goodii]OKH63310.1 hypothetical protein EB74_13285 [Mycobacterium sp. SWH-M5]MBU8810130.1 alpha/beta hydrolase [Mycolicibacterium goodii]MBU8819699.1 alpha/beta hydrolase [Mycolicibacterium goodii]MBU8827415.1 alpha/beta hydrolase [Mycolicibacterium goodii]MBU8832345.1 alpha/beta hydrolase [Mycolicibacterium goodii]